MVSTTFIGEVVAEEVPAAPTVTVPAVSCTLSLTRVSATAGDAPDPDANADSAAPTAADAKDAADFTPPWRPAGTPPLGAFALPDVAADESDLDRV